ncbi:MAG: hypothetical protein K8T26_01350 [Lentisphaerae bacterium]|nr:hypothetical protein [Lentisphaerota bacterium]
MLAFSIADGVLGIKAPHGQMRVRWRPEPHAEELIPGTSRWTPFAPEFRLIKPAFVPSTALAPPDPLESPDDMAMAAKARAFAAFHNEIPRQMVEAVERFQSHQWLLMLLLHRQPVVYDLVKSNPVLAYCLANNDQFRLTRDSVSLQLALGHCRQKQRVMLEWLGFPGSEAVARLLKRIPQEAAAPSLLRRLRNAAVADPSLVSQLAHVPILNAGALELMVNATLRPLIAPRLLLTVADNPDELMIGLAADQLASTLSLQGEIGDAPPLTPFTTVG